MKVVTGANPKHKIRNSNHSLNNTKFITGSAQQHQLRAKLAEHQGTSPRTMAYIGPTPWMFLLKWPVAATAHKMFEPEGSMIAKQSLLFKASSPTTEASTRKRAHGMGYIVLGQTASCTKKVRDRPHVADAGGGVQRRHAPKVADVQDVVRLCIRTDRKPMAITYGTSTLIYVPWPPPLN
jgi:hypothetical protein